MLEGAEPSESLAQVRRPQMALGGRRPPMGYAARVRKLELIQPCDFTPAWGAATGEPGVLRCVGCGHTVRDLSRLTEADALAFLERRGPSDCVRFRVDADERVLLADGPSSIIGRVARDARPMLAVAAMALAACTPGDPHGEPEARREGPAAQATASATAVVVDTASAPSPAPSAPPPAAPREPVVAVTASASARPLAPTQAKLHASHKNDRVVGRTPDGRPIVELSGY